MLMGWKLCGRHNLRYTYSKNIKSLGLLICS